MLLHYSAIGGGQNSASSVRACQDGKCTSVVRHEEADLLNEDQYRPFWIEYEGGNVTVGKGGQEEPFLQWDAGAYYGWVPTEVYVGIASGRYADGYWFFDKSFCE